ncbi:PAS domain-containing protein [Croceivirga thetidis]|uniref:PAS domain-containing protein n=1 Tax=Croceivirga thetidis TaxID=2721623 RepID=A0ABX1GSL8_9FLAO|nr:PAS domain-containing protein [Croceivirga thetidis]NKI32948.1 PAS domain-containing protein [Croceivirga thetidis]
MALFKKKYPTPPIQSLDFYLENFDRLCRKLKLENDLRELREVLKRELAPSVIKILEQSNYEALVVTNNDKKIVWANNGFKEMTGYGKIFAMGKKPTFLQGPNTAEQTKKEIRRLLKAQKRFSSSLVNYRKNGEEYICHIDVIPLKNLDDQVTHFLAMEREVNAA